MNRNNFRDMRDKWIEVDLDAIGHNLEEVRRNLNPGVRLMAVVKSNAYGLGAVAVAQELARLGVDMFGVTFLSEALELRNAGCREDILIFSPLSQEEYVLALQAGMIVTIGSETNLVHVEQAAEMVGRKARVHLKMDTGLGRFGLLPEEALAVARRAYSSPFCDLEGVYTHFAEGGKGNFTASQFDIFQTVVRKMEDQGITVPFRHCCGSSSFLRHPEMQLDMVRIGTLLWGQLPAGVTSPKIKLRDVFACKARIVEVRHLKKGSYLGYYRTYRLKRDSRVAVIPVGLADGLGVEAIPRPSGWMDLFKLGVKLLASFLNLDAGALRAEIHGQPVKIRGKVFMQFCLVELSPQVEAQAGDVAHLPVKRTLASLSLPRFYLRGRSPIEPGHLPEPD